MKFSYCSANYFVHLPYRLIKIYLKLPKTLYKLFKYIFLWMFSLASKLRDNYEDHY